MAAINDRLQIEYVNPGVLRPFAGNPRKISPKGLEKLQRSVEEFGFINPIIAQRSSRRVIAGHQRLKAAQAAGLTEVPVVWLDVDDVTAKAYNLADNRTAQESEWDYTPLADLLQELDTGAIDLTLTGFDEDELQRLMEWTPDDAAGFRQGEGFLKPDECETDFWRPPAELDLDKYEHVCLDYSGGKDSTLALAWAAHHCAGKHIVAIYSDTGVEFPGMGAHVAAAAEFFGVDLEIVKPEVEWWAWLRKEGQWPSLIYRNCQGAFIHKPVNTVKLKFPAEKTLLLDGSRANQAVRGSKKSKTSKHTSHKKLEAYDTYHPCFGLTDEAAAKLLAEIKPPLWRGYEQGFVRSACWCCPGQCGQQAYTLQRLYPGLADEIRWWEKRIGIMQPTNSKSFDDLVRIGREKAEKAANAAPKG